MYDKGRQGNGWQSQTSFKRLASCVKLNAELNGYTPGMLHHD
jgi:hypothetical protein